MALDRFFADDKPLCDLLVARPVGDQLEHLQLAVSELGERIDCVIGARQRMGRQSATRVAEWLISSPLSLLCSVSPGQEVNQPLASKP